MRNLFLVVVLALGACTNSDDDHGAPDAATAAPDAAAPDAAPLPRCADVGCPTVAFCNAYGCCSCHATGTPVQCLGPMAPPDACELP